MIIILFCSIYCWFFFFKCFSFTLFSLSLPRLTLFLYILELPIASQLGFPLIFLSPSLALSLSRMLSILHFLPVLEYALYMCWTNHLFGYLPRNLTFEYDIFLLPTPASSSLFFFIRHQLEHANWINLHTIQRTQNPHRVRYNGTNDILSNRSTFKLALTMSVSVLVALSLPHQIQLIYKKLFGSGVQSISRSFLFLSTSSSSFISSYSTSSSFACFFFISLSTIFFTIHLNRYLSFKQPPWLIRSPFIILFQFIILDSCLPIASIR